MSVWAEPSIGSKWVQFRGRTFAENSRHKDGKERLLLRAQVKMLLAKMENGKWICFLMIGIWPHHLTFYNPFSGFVLPFNYSKSYHFDRKLETVSPRRTLEGTRKFSNILPENQHQMKIYLCHRCSSIDDLMHFIFLKFSKRIQKNQL